MWVRTELGMDWGTIGAMRVQLERVGAVDSRSIAVPVASGGTSAFPLRQRFAAAWVPCLPPPSRRRLA